jgi:hypothetical protein
MASRTPGKDPTLPATVSWRSLAKGHRDEKFADLAKTSLNDGGWTECPDDWRAPFLPASAGAWSTFPALDDYFVYNGSGVMPGRTWVIAPDKESLERRWERLIKAPLSEKETLFHPHIQGDRNIGTVIREGLGSHSPRSAPISQEQGPVSPPIPYSFRSFDRQWIVPDKRIINRPNPALWESYSSSQVMITAPSDRSAEKGPALTLTALIPDLHHYNGRGGRAFPLWADAAATIPNVRQALLDYLTGRYGFGVTPADLIAYVAAIAAHPAYTNRFREDLSTPGLRIPLTADSALFRELADVGRTVIWLHTFGERMADAAAGRPPGPPRLPAAQRPQIPAGGAIPSDPASMPDTIEHDTPKQRLLLGTGYVENVPAAVWKYEVSGKQVLRQWFSYRKKNRERPIIGDRRPPSPLGDIQPDHWLAEYTTELINVLNVLALLVDLEPEQAGLLEGVCSGPLIAVEELRAAGALETTPIQRRRRSPQGGPQLFDVASSGVTDDVATSTG